MEDWMNRITLPLCLLSMLTFTTPLLGQNTWTIVVLPDTQKYKTASTVPIFQTQTQWIVDNKEDLNIQMVLHSGDITDDNLPAQWEDAKTAMSILDGEVPYMMAFGNHDIYPSPFDRSNTLINDYFSLSDNPLNSIMAERIPGDLSNTYSKFTAPDGRKVLVLSLEFLPRAAVRDWAGDIIEQNPEYTAIVLTHANLEEGNVVDGEPVANRVVPSGELLWDGLTGKYANVELVFSAHHLDQNDANPNGRLTSAQQSSLGVNGNIVHEIGFNSQQQPNGGNGYLRLYEFLDDGKTIQVQTYSPFLDVWLTDNRNEFQVELTPLPLIADFDADNDVDGADFLMWQRGESLDALSESDLADWKSNFGAASLVANTRSVPEPSSCFLALVTLASLLIGRRRFER